MCVKVYEILCFFLVVSLVRAYIHNSNNNEGTAYYNRPKTSYLNHHKINNNYNNHRNSYQYFSHRLRHTHNNNHLLARISNSDNSFKLKPTENPFKKLYVNPGNPGITTTTEKNLRDDDYLDDVDEKSETIKTYNVQEVQEVQENQENQENQDPEDQEEPDDEDADTEDDYDASEAEDWQAEEATEEPTEKTFTEYKWKHFGTRSRVEESRKNQGITSSLTGEINEALTHARKVVQQGACKTPRIRLIKIQSVYPDAGKAYIPHCTLLHRCSDETGCCRMDSMTCAPKTTERIDLYFYTGRPGNYKVEKLAFYNHTECHCVEKSLEVMSGDAAQDGYPIRPDIKTTSVQPLAEPLKRCRCPELYTAQTSHRNCRCDCKEGNRDCMRIKRGKEYFAMKDRLCIQDLECGSPACEFGVYNKKFGRCPRKQESLAKISTQ